jgi:hypothetical protein
MPPSASWWATKAFSSLISTTVAGVAPRLRRRQFKEIHKGEQFVGTDA